MNEQQIADALTSGMLYPTVGACLVLLSWLAARIRHGVPLVDQLKHSGALLLAALPMALSAGGVALLAGMEPMKAASLAIAALMMSAGLSAPKPPQAPPAE